MLRRSALGLVLASLASAALIQLGGCSDDASGPADAAPDEDAPRQKPGPVDDAGVDADAAPRPPPTIPACFGQAIPMTLSAVRTYVTVDMTYEAGAPVDAGDAGDGGPILGDFLLDFGANGSTIDFKAFPPPGPQPTICYGDAGVPGATCTFPAFDFFGSWAPVTLVTADYGFLFNSVRQAGIIGTDFLSVYPFSLDYYGKKVWKATKDSFCTEAQLLASGYTPIPTSGFYTNDFAKLRPLSDVLADPDASAGFVVPNVPTVPIAIGGVSALAQIDTGYDDRLWPHSINVNQALFDKLVAQYGDTLAKFTVRDLYLTTCVPGLSQRGRAYELPPGTNVDFLAEGGSVGRRDTGFMIFVKERLPQAEKCGGVETWTVPAAQLGASFLVDAQAVVFDPIASRVWLPK